MSRYSIRSLVAALCTMLFTLRPAVAQPVVLNIDISTEGLGTATQQPLTAGVIEVGWLDSGTTLADMQSFLTPGGPNFNLATARDRFNTVGTITFSAGSANSFGNGLIFDTLTLVSDHVTDAAAFAAYKNPTTGAAGKRIHFWMRNSANEAVATQQAFLQTPDLVGSSSFPIANDLIAFLDFEGNAATDSSILSTSDLAVGLIAAVANGGGIDTNGGSPADGLGLNGGPNVLLTASFSTTATLGFNPTSLGMAETAGTAELTVVRSGALTGTVTVNYTTVDGTAVAGTDYTTTAGVLSFGPDVISRTISVPILNRTGLQPVREFGVVLLGPVGGELGAAAATVTIVENPEPVGTLELSAATYSVNENGGPAVLSVTRTGGTYGPLSATISTANQTATAGQDYSALSNQAVDFADGDATAKTVNVAITDDSDFEGNETFQVTLSVAANGLAAAKSPAVKSLAAVGGGGGLSTSGSVLNLNSNMTITSSVTLSSLSIGAGTVVTFGSKSGGAPASFAPKASPFASKLAAVAAAGVVSAVVTIVDNDPPPTAGSVGFTAPSFAGSEAGGSITISVTRSNGTGGPVSVSYATSSNGGDTAVAGIDYTATSGTLNWANNEGGAKTFTVPVFRNNVQDLGKTFSVTLSAPTGGATILGAATAPVTIQNIDAAGVLAFSTAAVNVAENVAGQKVTLTITRTSGSDGPVSVLVNTGGGTAVAGTHYGPLVNAPVNFAAGQTSATVDIGITNNSTYLGNRTFNATLSNPSPANGPTLGAISTATVTIIEDETPQPGSFSFSQAGYTVPESVGTATITVLRTGGTDLQTTVNYTATNGTAGADDYTTTSGTLTFAQGDDTESFPVTILNDSLPEANETINLTLSTPTNGATLGTPASSVLTIENDDLPSRFSLSPSSVSVTEGSNVALAVNRTGGALDQTLSVNYATANGSAAAGSDYVQSNGTLVFGPNVLQQPITITTINDLAAENNETFTVSLSKVNAGDQSVEIIEPSTTTVSLLRSDAIDQPDALVSIKVSSPTFTGNNVYNSTGDGQIASATVSKSATASYYYRVENDGNLTDSYIVTGVGAGTSTKATVRYLHNDVDITSSIVGSGYPLNNLAPGARIDLVVEIKFTNATSFTGYGATITTTSANTPGKADTARAAAIVQ